MLSHGVLPPDERISQEAIDQAVATVRHLAGWHIWPVITEKIRLIVPGDPAIVLPTRRAVDVQNVVIDGQRVEPGRIWWDESGLVHIRGLRPLGDDRPRVFECDLTHGFESPADLIGVVGSIARRAASSQVSTTVGGISVGAPGGAVPQATEWRVLDLYRLGPLP